MRETTKADARDAARLIDAMEHIDTYERAVLSHDVPHEVCALHNAEASLTNTTKHHWIGPVNGYGARKIVDMCAAIAECKSENEGCPFSYILGKVIIGDFTKWITLVISGIGQF